MPIKILSQIIICAAGMAATALIPASQAMPMTFTGITMEVRKSNYQVTGGDNAASLMAAFNSGNLLCDVNIGLFTSVGGPQTCGTGSHNLSLLYGIDYVQSGATVLFELGADWGRGGIIMGADGGDILRSDDIWWANGWNHGDVIDFEISAVGAGSFQLLGFEGCCSGGNSLRYSTDGGRTFSAVTVTVPEPVPYTLMGLGLMGLILSRRRRG